MDPDGHFGEAVARTYDQDHGGTDAALIDATVACLLDLAGEGSALEFAVGTGRIALPLSAAGCDVHGIELSRAMVKQLRKKETGPPMNIVIGDMAEARVPGAFSLVFLVFNTIENLTSQAAQTACFVNAARHLTDGGRFLVETRVPPIQHLPFGASRLAFACDEQHIGVDEFDLPSQRSTSHHVWMRGAEHAYLSIPFRYVWPSELDLMARIAGLELEDRWADWDKCSFTNTSRKHISIWRKTAAS